MVDALNDVNVFEKAAYPQSVWITDLQLCKVTLS